MPWCSGYPRYHPRIPRLLVLWGRFPFVRTGQPDHYRTSYFDNEIGFFQGLLLKNHLLPTHYLGFDWSRWIVLINSEILITKGRVWPVSSDKWKAPWVSSDIPKLFLFAPCTEQLFTPYISIYKPKISNLSTTFEDMRPNATFLNWILCWIHRVLQQFMCLLQN